ncbi:hypothetical protein [Pseudomonas sp. KB-10]|uniref:cysteine dioxygenase family protein n=1 Tax=Pseudomonas sp. KB-10 TaxID=2292264 RepID=UPI001BAFC955|nr:hypothetical protein [Pseudomonas sp. KB-10]
MAYGLMGFIRDLRRVVASATDEASILAQVEPLARRMAQLPDWLNDSMYEADPACGYGTTLLHVEADQTLFVVVDSWLPGRGVEPHDHGTWAAVVGLVGEERNCFWQRTDDGSNAPGSVELQRLEEHRIGPGEVLLMPSGTIHSVTNDSAAVTLSLHIYGRHLNCTDRRLFDLQNKCERPFLIEPR